MPMIRIEGRDLEQLKASLCRKEVHLLRVSWHGDHATFKTNSDVWSPPLGTVQEPY